MPTPFRTLCKQAIANALAEITPDNGYISDLSIGVHPADGGPQPRVYRGRAFFGDDDPLPMLAVLERPDPADELADPPIMSRSHQTEWNLIIQGFVEDDKDNPTDTSDLLLAEVKQRLAVERDRKDANGRLPDPFGLGGKREKNRIEKLSFGAGVSRPPDEVSAKAYFWLGVTLTVIEDPLFPFA